MTGSCKSLCTKIGLILVLGAILSCSRYDIASVEGTNKDISSKSVTGTNPDMSALLYRYKIEKDSLMHFVVATSDKMYEKRKPNSELGNFMADILYNEAKLKGYEVDFALTNYGGIRSFVPNGNVLLSNVFEIMPFDNTIVIVEVSDSVMKMLINLFAQKKELIISGATALVRDEKVVELSCSNGKTLSSGNSYTIAMSDYLANGGDGCDFLRDCKRKELNILYRDGLLNGFTDRGQYSNFFSLENTIRVRYE